VPISPPGSSPVVWGASFYIGQKHIVKPLRFDYKESGFMIPTILPNEKDPSKPSPGMYMPILFLDKAFPIIFGREIWGFRKFQADFDLAITDEEVRATLTKDGTQLVNVSMKLGDAVNNPTIPQTPPIFIRKFIPSAAKNEPAAVDQIVSLPLTQNTFTKMRPCTDASLTLGTSDSEPLGAIPVKDVVNAASMYSENNFILDFGDIAFDYAAQVAAHA
ncbi:MAG: acetoacetate decarboxylase family protein, partial [Rhodothermales bacterium]|nr:acetoacetate decarboxylase family protein [Rhodothermales bacterium]